MSAHKKYVLRFLQDDLWRGREEAPALAVSPATKRESEV